MGERILSNWIDTYMDYVSDTESAKIFHKWVAISTLASVLQKKVKLELGRLKYFPNLYIILVSEPGIAKKSQAISYGTELLKEIDTVHTSASSITREALIEDLEMAVSTCELPSGDMFLHTSYSVISPEFEIFLGQKTDNAKIITLLTDLFDTSDVKPWIYRTKGSGTYELPAVFLNLIGATTPDSLASSLPVAAIGGGLCSRMVYVWADRGEKKNYKPEMGARELDLKAKLIHDLSEIHKICGCYTMSQDCELKWKNWYESFDEQDPSRICQDNKFRLWYSRKPLMIVKVGMIHAASESSTRIVEWRHLQRAIDDIESTEISMAKTFRSIGKSSSATELDQVIETVKKYKYITEEKLMQIFWKDLDDSQFDSIMNTAVRMGMIERKFASGSSGVSYRYVG